MKKQLFRSLAIVCLFCFSVQVARAQTTQAKDELNYSASMCIPRTGGQFQSGDTGGFAWNDKGFWANGDDDEAQTLVCPIPFDPRAKKADGSFGTIEVKLNVIDNSYLHEVVAKLFGKDPEAENSVELGRAFTSNQDFGRFNLTLNGAPGNNIKYLWLQISVPPLYWVYKSAVIGYRVNRLGFD